MQRQVKCANCGREETLKVSPEVAQYLGVQTTLFCCVECREQYDKKLRDDLFEACEPEHDESHD